MSRRTKLRRWAQLGAVLGGLQAGMTAIGCRHDSLAGGTVQAAGLVLLTAAFAVTGRMGWLGFGTWRAVRRLPTLAPPPALREAASRAGLPTVRLVCGRERAAFCTGLLRPRVHVTAGLVAVLGADELAAVLIHEREHARRRDPVRRLLHTAAADIFICLPLLRWWRRDHIQRAELKADQAAIDSVGPRAVARALALAVTPAPVAHAVGFEGGIDVRLTQLLGDEPVREAPSKRLIALTLAGLGVMGYLGMCAGMGAVSLLGL